MIKKVVFCGEEAYSLESDELRCVCIPRRGGKIASIKHRETGFELLFQNPKGYFSDADSYSHFEDFEACGFDDAFPSINAETVSIGGSLIPYPDHGEIWHAEFDCTEISDGISLTYDSKLLNYTFKKTFIAEGNKLKCLYRIKNNSEKGFPCFYAMHCLVNIEEGMRLIFPDGTDNVLNVMDSPRLGRAGTRYSFPKAVINGGEYDFTSLAAYDEPMMDKYYVSNAVKEGRCGYEYVQSGIRALIVYDCQKLPYLGFWVTQGGFRGDYNCALEPTNGYYDSIGCSQENGKCPVLEPGETMEFEIGILLEKIN